MKSLPFHIGHRLRLVVAGFAIVAIASALTLSIFAARSGLAAPRNASCLPDLAIGDVPGLGIPGVMSLAQPAQRPGILVAWRNTKKVLEVEALVKNLGCRAASGLLTVEVLDGAHHILAKEPPATQPFVVAVPRASDGGDTGITVQVPGTYRLNQILDGIDRDHGVYCLRIRIQTLQFADANNRNNAAVKCYNNAAMMVSNGIAAYQFYLRNSSNHSVSGRILIEQTKLPSGWSLETKPAGGSQVTLRPDAIVLGSIVLTGPAQVQEGAYVDIRPTLISTSNDVIDADEFYVAADYRPPQITHAFVAPGRDAHSLYVNVRAIDSVDGVAEASGVTVEWSTDDGFTVNQRALTYVDGNFLSATGFDGDVGPFPDGTRVKLAIRVHDVVGNTAKTKTVDIQIPLTKVIDIS
jgi:hypothetical protein